MIWFPFTQAQTALPEIRIVRGKGSYLFDEKGQSYLDLIASWWVNIHGHAHPEISEVIDQQAKTLEHVIFSGFTHNPAEELVNSLKPFLPHVLNHFFFSDNGSTAVEVALKMSYQYWINQNLPKRPIFMGLQGGYHGDTLGAMSVAGKNSTYHGLFSDLFFKTFSIKVPYSYENVRNLDMQESKSLERLEKFLKKNGQNVCSLIVEPLVQGAAGMKTYSVGFLEQLIDQVRRYDILVIFDEVMTGFYRTGKCLALDSLKVKPDLLCLSKGLTGGFLPLSLTIAHDKIYQSFLSENPKKAFLHGHSYTANPIACAAACKSLEILKRSQTQESIQNLIQAHKKNLPNLQGGDKKRHLGTIAAFDVKTESIAKNIEKNLLKKGILLRPLGTTLYMIPPYCVSQDEIEWSYQEIQKELNKVRF